MIGDNMLRKYNRRGMVIICGFLVILILTIYSRIEVCYPEISSDTAMESMFIKAADKVKLSVVSIVTKHANEVKEKISERIGFGSGMIIDLEGYILTADSVIADAEDIEVILSDRRKFKGELKGIDRRFGVAVIKIDAKGLPVVGFGDSDALKVMQFVVAAGYGYGNESGPTFTVGVISALNRRLPTRSNYMFDNLIQTDAAVLPEFGGGPLVNIKGEVIGILYIRVVDGVSYAIPINSVKQAIDDLIKHDRVNSGWLGIGIDDIKPEVAKSLGLPDLNGVFVMEVFPDTPAEKVGLKVGDVIRSFNGKDVKSSSDLMLAVAKTDVGKRVKVLIIRDKSEKEIEVEVGEINGKSLMENALILVRRIENPFDRTMALVYIAMSHADIGQDDKSFKILSQAYRSTRRIKDTSDKSRAMAYVAGRYTEIKQKEKSTELLYKALHTAESIENLSRKAMMLAGIGKRCVKNEKD